MSYENQKTSIKCWAEDDRPREKFASKGRHVLSDAELIAILIGSGNKKESAVELSKRILISHENNLCHLGKLSIAELAKFKGIGQAKAISILAGLGLGLRRKQTSAASKPIIQSSKDAYEQISPQLRGIPHEEFWMLLLNRANQVISKQLVSKGGQSETTVDPKIIFRLALEQQASSLIFAHNHPSGNLKPSQADIFLTKKLTEAGRLLDILVLDHLIIVEADFFSLADHSLM